MRFLTLVAACALQYVTITYAAGDCEAVSDQASRENIDGYVVSYATRPESVAIGEHFGMVVNVCTPDGKWFEGELGADADMPSHGHGMNYRAVVTRVAPGRFEIEGFMFHMPGEWRLLFSLDDGGKRRTLELWRFIPW